MKTHLIVICIVLALGCQQSEANVANQVDPLGIYLSRDGIDYSATYLPRPGESIDLALKNTYPLDQQIIIATDVPAKAQARNVLGRVIRPIKNFVQSVVNIISKVLSTPVKILAFILSPLRWAYNIAKFFVKVFFLPLTIGWKVFQLLLYPFKLIFNIMTSQNHPPQYVPGLPNQFPYAPSVYGL